jgi:hypothetical protein
MTRAARILATLAVLAIPAAAFAQSAAQVTADRLQGRATPEAHNRLQRAIEAAQVVGSYFASPTGVDNATCDQANPCTAQGAFMRCHLDFPPGDVCNIQLADGDYINPGINVFYYRFANFTGNCANPSSVRLIGTTPGTLVWVQDHAVGIIGCVRFEGHVGGVSAIATRQHVIVDYYNLVFGNMPGGTHVSVNELSIASCGSTVKIAGDGVVHASAGKFGILNLPCEMNLNGVFNINFFVNTGQIGIVTLMGVGRFTGSYFVNGVKCNNDGTSIVHHPGVDFPGNNPGNC